MAKTKIISKISSYGIYEGWDRDSRELPVIQKFTEEIPARIGIEFGYILNIKKAKGKRLYFRIEHPPFTDGHGEVMPPFTGELYVRTNDWDFFLGDTIWEPVSDKAGSWRLVTIIEEVILADMTLNIYKDLFMTICHMEKF